MTTNPPSVIDAAEFTVRRTITIAAPIEKVWAAVTEAEHIARWFPERAVLDPVAVGTVGNFWWEDHGDFPVRIEAVDVPHSITYRWGNNNGTPIAALDPANSTVFTFTLEALGDGTQLTVVESGFDTLSDPTAAMEGNRGGWDWELDELVAFLESES